MFPWRRHAVPCCRPANFRAICCARALRWPSRQLCPPVPASPVHGVTPQDSLPRSVMLLLTGAHLPGGAGIEQFMDRHKDDGLAQRMPAVLVIAQLGALQVLPNSRFAPGNRALAAARACPASASLPRPAPRAISHTIPAHWKTGTGMARIAHLLG